MGRNSLAYKLFKKYHMRGICQKKTPVRFFQTGFCSFGLLGIENDFAHCLVVILSEAKNLSL
jgi:hypothetical protein